MPARPEAPRPGPPSGRVPRVTVGTDGPLLVEGPVEVVTEDGSVLRSDRFTVAICTCGRSAAYPWCDTSHRRASPPGPTTTGEEGRA